MATQQDPSSTGEPMFHIPESACEHLLMVRDQLLATLVSLAPVGAGHLARRNSTHHVLEAAE